MSASTPLLSIHRQHISQRAEMFHRTHKDYRGGIGYRGCVIQSLQEPALAVLNEEEEVADPTVDIAILSEKQRGKRLNLEALKEAIREAANAFFQYHSCCLPTFCMKKKYKLMVKKSNKVKALLQAVKGDFDKTSLAIFVNERGIWHRRYQFHQDMEILTQYAGLSRA